jgi:hypothetical protein
MAWEVHPAREVMHVAAAEQGHAGATVGHEEGEAEPALRHGDVRDGTQLVSMYP